MPLKHMKTLIVLVVSLLSVGCATVKDIYVQLVGGKPNTPEQKQKILRDSVLGEYEFKGSRNTFKIVLLENGVKEHYQNGRKGDDGTKWSIVDGEIHDKYNSELIVIYRINPDKSITFIATIKDGKREDRSKEQQKQTYKKIKELTAEEQKQQKSLRDSVVGEYELKNVNGNTVKWVFLDNGIREYYVNGTNPAENKWSIVDGEIHIKYDDLIGVYRFNKDKSITEIATIEDGKRTDYSKESQSTFKRIK